jgi:predicted Fe-Mo cluster-binding NifX family protein
LALDEIAPVEDALVTSPVTSDSVDSVPVAEVDKVLRFAVPTSEGLLCSHFGHCQEFTLIDVDSPSSQVVGVTTIPAPEHEPGLLPGWLADKGAGFIIAGGMGSRAQQLFAEQGVKVITGAPVAEPEAVVQHYLAGSLVTGENVCDH